MKIIFVCKYNAFRSKIALSYFNKINKNKEIKAVSRGFIMGGKPDKIQKGIAKKMGVEIKGKQNCINLKELIEADKIILVANDIPKKMFDYKLINLKKKLENWRIKDEQKQNPKNIEKIIKKIKSKIGKLNKQLKLIK